MENVKEIEEQATAAPLSTDGVSNGGTGDDRQDQHYNKSKDYWEGVAPTVNGMLGGFENVTNIGEFDLIVLWTVR